MNVSMGFCTVLSLVNCHHLALHSIFWDAVMTFLTCILWVSWSRIDHFPKVLAPCVQYSSSYGQTSLAVLDVAALSTE